MPATRLEGRRPTKQPLVKFRLVEASKGGLGRRASTPGGGSGRTRFRSSEEMSEGCLSDSSRTGPSTEGSGPTWPPAADAVAEGYLHHESLKVCCLVLVSAGRSSVCRQQ